MDCKRRVFVQLVEHFLGLGAALELDHNAHAALIEFIAQVGDLVDPIFAHQFGDALDQGRFVDLIGDFGNDDLVPAALPLFDVGNAAHDQASLAGGIG